MSGGALRWAVGLAASALVHGASGAALWLTLVPDAPPAQGAESAELALQSYPVRQSAAIPAQPDAPGAVQSPATGPRASQQALRSDTARPVTAPAVAVSPVADPGAALSAVDAAGASLPAAPPTSPALPATTAVATSATARPLPTDPVQPQRTAGTEANSLSAAAQIARPLPAGAVLTPTQPPASDPIEGVAAVPLALGATAAPPARLPTLPQTGARVSAQSARPTALSPVQVAALRPTASPPPVTAIARVTQAPVPSTALPLPSRDTPAMVTPAAQAPSVAPAPRPARATQAAPTALAPAPDRSTPATALQPPASPAPARRPQGQPVTATLALPGAETMTDPLSLAALQSFLAPQDQVSDADAVRDGLASVLSALPCSRVQARYDPETQALVLSGHVPDAAQAGPLAQAVQGQMGADIAVRADLLVLPAPQCGALTGLAQIGLPQSNDQITNPLMVGPGTHARQFSYRAGDQLVLDIESPDYVSYVYVDYFDSAGQVIHLSPNEVTPLVLSPPAAPLRIGALTPNDPGLFITIGPPFGQEIAVAFATSQQLFEGPRPLVEPAGPYLADLRGAIADARAQDPEFKGEWAYFFVSTSAR